jgi:hypothetical protein
MKAYYVTPVLGNGGAGNPFRPVLASASGVNWSAVLPSGVDGKPLFQWCLVAVGGDELAISNIPGSMRICGIAEMERPVTLATLDSLTDKGVNTNCATSRLLVRSIGRTLQGVGFNENDLWVYG